MLELFRNTHVCYLQNVVALHKTSLQATSSNTRLSCSEASSHGLLQWVSGTTVRPYLSRQRATESRHVGADGPLEYIPKTFTTAVHASAKMTNILLWRKSTAINSLLTFPTFHRAMCPLQLATLALPISIYFQSINFLRRSKCPTLEMTDENYAVDELHQSDQVMQYRYMKMSNYGVPTH